MNLSCLSPSFGRFEAPVLTTQDYFAQALSKKALQEKPALAKRMREIASQQKTATAAKFVWAITLVLPIIYALGTLISKPTFPHQKTKELLALKKSVGEFGEILEIVGCKKEREEEKRTPRKYNWVVYDIRQDALNAFMRPYENQKVFLQAIFKATESMLKHFKAHFAVDGYKWVQSPENRESNRELALNYAYFIRRINEHSHHSVGGNNGIRYLKGDEAFDQGWNYLTSRKEMMMQLCDRKQRR